MMMSNIFLQKELQSSYNSPNSYGDTTKILNKMKKITLLILILSIISCGNKKKIEGGETSLPTDTIQQEQIEKRKALAPVNNDDSLPREVVFNFYNWYVNDIYMKDKEYEYYPHYKKYSKHKYGLDVEQYTKSIQSITFFSPKYKDFLIKRAIECHKQMLNKIFDINPNEEYYDFEDCPKCWFIVKEWWFGSQEEKNNRFDILDKVEKGKDTYYYFVQDYIDNPPFSVFKVEVVKVKDEYKINAISIVRGD